MSNVKDIFNKHTPLVISTKVPWDKISKCVVIYEDNDGNAMLHISEMDWKDRMWLSAELQNFNAAEGAEHWMNRG